MCPSCNSSSHQRKNGFYLRASDSKRIQRFHCASCQKSYSSQTSRIDYRFRKRHFDKVIFRGLCKGNSQNGLAFLLGVKPVFVARRIKRFGPICAKNLSVLRKNLDVSSVMIDEMETFEHTKCKPLTMPIVVESRTRRILSLDVGQIAAKGPLAKISVKKYGKRRCERHQVLKKVFGDLQDCLQEEGTILSDKSTHYPQHIARNFPYGTSVRVKGHRPCVVGQGELKAEGFDPLFSLNHTYARGVLRTSIIKGSS